MVTAGFMDHPILKKIREKGSVDIIRLLLESAIEPKTEGKEKIEQEEENAEKQNKTVL